MTRKSPKQLEDERVQEALVDMKVLLNRRWMRNENETLNLSYFIYYRLYFSSYLLLFLFFHLLPPYSGFRGPTPASRGLASAARVRRRRVRRHRGSLGEIPRRHPLSRHGR